MGSLILGWLIKNWVKAVVGVVIVAIPLTLIGLWRAKERTIQKQQRQIEILRGARLATQEEIVGLEGPGQRVATMIMGVPSYRELVRTEGPVKIIEHEAVPVGEPALQEQIRKETPRHLSLVLKPNLPADVKPAGEKEPKLGTATLRDRQIDMAETPRGWVHFDPQTVQSLTATERVLKPKKKGNIGFEFDTKPSVFAGGKEKVEVGFAVGFFHVNRVHTDIDVTMKRLGVGASYNVGKGLFVGGGVAPRVKDGKPVITDSWVKAGWGLRW